MVLLRAPRHLAVTHSNTATLVAATASFESLDSPGTFAHLLECAPDRPWPTLAQLPGAQRLRIAEIERDDGLRDRDEAPQYFAPPPQPRPLS